MSTYRTRQGFTLIELLVVISIIAILAGLLLPAVTLVKNKANQTANGNNQKQIVTSMVAYQGDYDGSWPFSKQGTTGTLIVVTAAVSGADGKLASYASFETLAAAAQLPNKIFFAKGQKEAVVGGQNNTAPPYLSSNETAFNASTWSSRNAGGGEIAWAYDWSVGSEVASYRIVLADRGNWHKSKVIAVAADSSIKTLTAGTSVAGITIGMDTNPIPATTMGGTVNTDANFGGPNGENSLGLQDFIYSGVGDGTGATGAIADGNTTISNGDGRRAWVK